MLISLYDSPNTIQSALNRIRQIIGLTFLPRIFYGIPQKECFWFSFVMIIDLLSLPTYSPSLRKKSELLYYNDENLMFCHLQRPLSRNSLNEICLMPFSSLEVRKGVALIIYFG